MTQSRSDEPIYTIGHSTRTLEEFVAILRAFGVSIVADVRTIPRSRRNPQYAAGALRPALRRQGIRYAAVPELGGLRRARSDSPNTAWRNASFRGYADYMATPPFAEGLSHVQALARGGTVALMCAEAVPWRCHRSLVADALVARGARVEHILSARRANPHRITPFAQIQGERVTYPAAAADTPLPTAAPFHLEATVRMLQRRPANRVDLFRGDRYSRVLSHGDALALAEVENHGTIDAPDLRLTIHAGDDSEASRDDWVRRLRAMLGLDVEPDGLRRLARVEPRVRALALALRGLRPPRFPDLFETFAQVVPFQQLSLDAGAAIVARLVARFGRRLEHDGTAYYAFPAAEAVAAARLTALRGCGLSAHKADALRGLARAIARGELTAQAIAALDSRRALKVLCDLPGIGPWSANLVLLRGFGRLDVFPPGDTGATRALRVALQLRPGASVDRLAARCGDLRGYLYYCALGGALLGQGLVHPARID